MMGLDIKFLGPQLERGVKALESIAESMEQMSLTAQAQRRILEGHNVTVEECGPAVEPLHLVPRPNGAKRPR
jgi:hypothetical protein